MNPYTYIWIHIKPWIHIHILWVHIHTFAYIMLCAVWYHLYNLKNVKNTHGGVLLSVKFDRFTKSNTPPRVFFTFFKLYKWYQIAKHITYNLPVVTINMFQICDICPYKNILYLEIGPSVTFIKTKVRLLS